MKFQKICEGLDQGTTSEFLEGVLTEFKDRIAVVSSFGADSAVLLHQVTELDPTVPVLFLNTGKLFGETLRYRDTLQMRLGLTDVRTLGPHPNHVKEFDPKGTLFSDDADQCCSMRKVWPLKEALEPFDAWISGRKRFQSQERAALQRLECVDGFIKINPLADWGARDVLEYQALHNLPEHPLVREGYLSIGCMPCTDRVSPGEDQRAGRWRRQKKSECGIHNMAAAFPRLAPDDRGD